MRDKIYNVLNKTYGIVMSIAFWGGLLPLPPFIVAICIGGSTGESIATFLYDKYYPWVIAAASIAVIIGLIGMYVSGQEAFSTKSFGTKKKASKNAESKAEEAPAESENK